MIEVSSADVQKNFKKYRLIAENEVVHVTYHNKPCIVMISADEYERLKKRDKQVLSIEDLPQDFVDQIEKDILKSDESNIYSIDD